MKFWSTRHCSAMSAPSVSLFPDDADSAKIYLAVMQTLLNNLWIRISRQIWISQRNRFSCCLVGPKGTVWWKNRDQKFSRYGPFNLLLLPYVQLFSFSFPQEEKIRAFLPFRSPGSLVTHTDPLRKLTRRADCTLRFLSTGSIKQVGTTVNNQI
jgi:hypothetical protein